MQTHTITVNGIPMRWLEQGHGPPVIFIHGLPTNPRLWRYVIRPITGWRAMAWEMVGYGASIAHGRGRNIAVEKQADYLIEWMNSLGIARAVIVGHDVGGGVAQIAAVRHPRRVGGLVLVDSIGFDGWVVPSLRLMRSLSAVFTHIPHPLFRATFKTLIRVGHETREQAEEAFAEHWPHYASPDGPDALLRQARALNPRDTMEIVDDLPRLDVPAQILWGENDSYHKPELGERLAGALHTTAEVLPNGRHFMPEDHPERVRAALDRVMGAIDEAGREAAA